MSVVEQIKLAAAELNPDEQYELFRWWVESDAFGQRQLAALKRDVAVGIEELNSGHYRTYDQTNAMQLAKEVSRSGRERLAKVRKSPEA
jgi:hypothetical protein